jgi:hypothetical protein
MKRRKGDICINSVVLKHVTKDGWKLEGEE